MSKHTPTPWKRDKYGHVVGADGNYVVVARIAISAGPRDPIAEVTGDRAFACVNAFHSPDGREIATEKISEGLVWEMVDALQNLADHHNALATYYHAGSGQDKAQRQARALLAKLEE
jgi:hypothetical protein